MLDDIPACAAGLSIRMAAADDLDRIDDLRRLSISRLLLPELTPEQRVVMVDSTPLDPHLVHDRTYYVAHVGDRLAACGGWSRRSALIRTGSAGKEGDAILDPASDAASVRAMYTHPDFARLGIGSLLLATSETAARIAGFRRARLIATAPGRRLFAARGWSISGSVRLGHDHASAVEVAVMEKML